MIHNTKTSYGWASITLHWLMTLMIFFLFGLGLYMVELTYYDAWYKGSLELHKSLGLIMLFLLLLRMVWRQISMTPATLPGPRWEQRSGHLMHIGLYVVMMLLMLSGFLISSADGRAISVFGLINVPAIPLSISNQEDISGKIHELLAWSLLGMVALHALAALKHQLFNRDNGLGRMLKPG